MGNRGLDLPPIPLSTPAFLAYTSRLGIQIRFQSNPQFNDLLEDTMKRIPSCVRGVLVAIVLAALPVCAAERYRVIVQRTVPATMRDGVILRADIYRPDAPGKFPVLLERTPYNKVSDWSSEFGVKAAQRGYVAVIQDTRGRYTSDGVWYPLKYESQDGYDTVEWAAALPYSDGKVGMVGGSYMGATQMLAAIAHPPHLAGIMPFITASNYHDGWTYTSAHN